MKYEALLTAISEAERFLKRAKEVGEEMKCPECNDAKWEDRREELWELLEKVYHKNFPACEATADYVAGKLWGIRQLALAVQEHLDGKITRLKMLAGIEE